MKRGGLLFAALLFLGGVLRIAGPGTMPLSALTESAMKQAAKHTSSSLPGTRKNTYAQALMEDVRKSFACSEETRPSQTDDVRHWNVPPASRNRVQFVIAIVPDPVH